MLEKEAAALEKEYTREARALKKIIQDEENKIHREGVHACRINRLNKIELHNLDPNDIGAAYLYILVPDRETELRITKESQLTGCQLKDQLEQAAQAEAEVEGTVLISAEEAAEVPDNWDPDSWLYADFTPLITTENQVSDISDECTSSSDSFDDSSDSD